MKGLDRLIRLQQWRLDEQRRKVADLERLTARLRSEVAQLEEGAESADAARETGPTDRYPDLSARRERLQRSLADLQREMARAVEDVAVVARELEKLELIRRRKQQGPSASRKSAAPTSERDVPSSARSRASGS